MASNAYVNFPSFDPEPTTTGSRFIKYVDRFKNDMIAMDIKDKARKRALFLHTAGFKVQDIFEILEDTGDDFETAATKLIEYIFNRRKIYYTTYINSDKYTKSKMKPATTIVQD